MRTVSSEIQDLARRLLAFEEAHHDVDSTSSGAPSEDAAVRVIDKLRLRLIQLAGVAGFRSLLSRALTLAQAEVSALERVEVRADATLEGFAGNEEGAETAKGQAGIVLVAHLLELLVTFIGASLTLRLVRDKWPEASMEDTDLRTEGRP
jgi:hypothetical protein